MNLIETSATPNPALRAAKAAGGQTALAKALGCTPQNVQHMCATGQIPAKHVIRIEQATGISRHELRPDLHPEQGDAMRPVIRAKSGHWLCRAEGCCWVGVGTSPEHAYRSWSRAISIQQRKEQRPEEVLHVWSTSA